MSINRVFKTAKAVPVEPAEIQEEVTFTSDTTAPIKSASPNNDYIAYRRVGRRVYVRFFYQHTSAGTEGSGGGAYYIKLPYTPSGFQYFGLGNFFSTATGLVLLQCETRNGTDDLILYSVSGANGAKVLLSDSRTLFADNFLTISGQIEYDTDDA